MKWKIIIVVLSALFIMAIINVLYVKGTFEKELTLEEKQETMAQSIKDSQEREELREIKRTLAEQYLNENYGVAQPDLFD